MSDVRKVVEKDLDQLYSDREDLERELDKMNILIDRIEGELANWNDTIEKEYIYDTNTND